MVKKFNRCGIVVAADKETEWLIPWWWMNYSLNNSYPVTFVNFGRMSLSMVEWCKERGEVLDYLHPVGFDLEGKEKLQATWMKKPFALLQSCYDKTVWFDLDCHIREEIGELFTFCENPAGLGVVKEPTCYQESNLQKGLIKPGEVMYNAGVIVFQKGSEILKRWTNELLFHHEDYYADQDALSRLLSNSDLPFTKIDPIYNWIPVKQENPQAKVIHLVVEFKNFIKDRKNFLKYNMLFRFP
jgi:hypothetical protein